MKRFQELTIKTTSTPEETVRAITAQLPPQWMRDAKREADIVLNVGGKFFCFEVKASPAGPARLWAAPSDGGIAVKNIIPIDKTELTPDEYNEILGLFVRDAINGHFKYEISKPDVKLTDLVSKATSEKFRVFSSCANKSNGRSHPLDETRWLDFIYSVARQSESIESDELQFFLREDGWDEQSAQNLTEDFSYGLRAMRHALASAEQEE